ncbi:MAG TPA: YfcC family protein [Ktedonobacteraceae bacterium]|nr:YfcC family protein [Ktedonobacteraceae bacterium]
MDDAPNQDGSSTRQTSQTSPSQKQEEQVETHEAESQEAAEQKKPGFQFPSTFAILFAVTIVVAILTWIIPAGVYKLDANGDPIPGTYHQVASSPQGVSAILLAPINGMYGILSKPPPVLPEDTPNEAGPGNVSVYNEGELYGSIGVALFVLMIGAFITMTMKTGAIAAGIGSVTKALQGREIFLIPVLMLLFALGGTTFGMGEETLGFYPIIIVLFMGLGYDTLTAAATIALGAGLGVAASTVNPFATGIASDAAGISISEGLLLRIIMFVVFVAIGIFFVMRYARRVKADPSRSIVADLRERHRREFLGKESEQEELPELTTRRKLILGVFGLAFLILIYSVIPWSDLGLPFPTLGWWFGELAALFMLAAVIIGIIAGYGDQEIVETFVQGARDFLTPALIIAVARGVTVIMKNGLIIDTVLNWLEGLVAGTGSVAFANLMYIINLPLAFLVPSSSAHATLAMPILAPLADFAKLPRSIVVTAYQSASGLLNLITPTSVIIMGGLAVARIGYDRWFRFVWPLLIFILVATMILLSLAAFGLGK